MAEVNRFFSKNAIRLTFHHSKNWWQALSSINIKCAHTEKQKIIFFPCLHKGPYRKSRLEITRLDRDCEQRTKRRDCCGFASGAILF